MDILDKDIIELNENCVLMRLRGKGRFLSGRGSLRVDVRFFTLEPPLEDSKLLIEALESYLEKKQISIDAFLFVKKFISCSSRAISLSSSNHLGCNTRLSIDIPHGLNKVLVAIRQLNVPRILQLAII